MYANKYNYSRGTSSLITYSVGETLQQFWLYRKCSYGIDLSGSGTENYSVNKPTVRYGSVNIQSR